MYHKHTFHKSKTLETTLHLNMNGNDMKGIRKEEYPSLEYRNQYDFDNFRWSEDWNWIILLIGSARILISEVILVFERPY